MMYNKDRIQSAKAALDSSEPTRNTFHLRQLPCQRHALAFAKEIADNFGLPAPETPAQQRCTLRPNSLLALYQRFEARLNVPEAKPPCSAPPTPAFTLPYDIDIDPNPYPASHYQRPTLQVIFAHSACTAYEAVACSWLNADTLRLQLVLHRSDQPSIQLHQSHISVHRISVAHTLAQAYRHGLFLLEHGLKQLGEQPLPERPVAAQLQAAPHEPLYRALGQIAARYGAYGKIKLIERFKFERWQISVEPSTQAANNLQPDQALPQKPLPHHREVLDQADPFIADTDSHTHVFFEQIRHGDPHGVIAVQRLSHDGQFEPSETIVLKEPFHLSYPNVFAVEGQWFMLPETAERQQVRLYRAQHFPTQWQLACVLIDQVKLYDPTLYFHAGRWWLFGSQENVCGMDINAELFLYFSETLESEQWTAHPMNPVVSDCRCARPAGAIQRVGERLIRPAQHCAPRYGYGISYQEIVQLSPTQYEERTWYQRLPEKRSGVLAQHSHNTGRHTVVSDRLVRHPKRTPWLNRLAFWR